MYRNALNDLKKWTVYPKRKPLVLRGARQVGKTWLVRELAKICQLDLIELNFEDNPNFTPFFSDNDPQSILLNLSSFFGKTIHPEKSLLFLDEIQVMPELYAKLRWFYEKMPQLVVIAAGSLLEFMLEDYAYSAPVGRVSFYFLEPLSFEEFLLAKKNEFAVNYLKKFTFQEKIIAPIHDQLMADFKEYTLIGGLPAAVNSWITDRSLEKIHPIQQELLATYRDDFSKYAKSHLTPVLNTVLNYIPNTIGKKFIYRHADEHLPIEKIKNALTLLCHARLCHRVQTSHANGIPLASEINSKTFKIIFLDVGLLSASLQIPLHQLTQTQDLNLIHKGALSEQITGQLLRLLSPYYVDQGLFYWTREESNASSEVDYVIQHHANIIPIEVKSGSTGSLKSLHYFMAEKKYSRAIRINSDLPSIVDINLKTNTGKSANYQLLSIPFYLIQQIGRLLDL